MDIFEYKVMNDDRMIEEIVDLHIKAFPTFFLTKLGDEFLKLLYKGYMDDENSGIIVSKNDDQLLGFIAYSTDYPAFFKKLLKDHFFKFAFLAFQAAVRHPSFALKLLGALKKSDDVVKEEKYVEISSICVDPSIQGKGIGSKLINYMKDNTDFGKFAFISLETDAVSNDAANCFYKKNGFQQARTYITREGREMNEYHFSRDF